MGEEGLNHVAPRLFSTLNGILLDEHLVMHAVYQMQYSHLLNVI